MQKEQSNQRAIQYSQASIASQLGHFISLELLSMTRSCDKNCHSGSVACLEVGGDMVYVICKIEFGNFDGAVGKHAHTQLISDLGKLQGRPQTYL